MNKSRKDRKIKNLLLSANVQLAFALNVIVLSTFFIIGIAFVLYFQLGDFIQNIITIADFDPTMSKELNADWNGTVLWMGVFMLAYMLITVFSCVLYTHRMVGPTVAFKRHITNLIKGNYDSKIKLRNGDAFEDVAELLNELGDCLQNSEGNKPHKAEPEQRRDAS